MAIKMLREPSETPNINNIDDIVGLRYAYGNQNGFVKGKGTEISSTTETAAIRINSGRIVLQGVEVDIDAAGVKLAIDKIATQRYYVVYLEVNLALNKAELKLSFGTSTYPTIELGDDLTTTTNGVARFPIYKFEAINGVISSVNKLIVPIQYTKDVKVENAKHADEATHAVKSTDSNNADYCKKLNLYIHTIMVAPVGSSGNTIVDYGTMYYTAITRSSEKIVLNTFQEKLDFINKYKSSFRATAGPDNIKFVTEIIKTPYSSTNGFSLELLKLPDISQDRVGVSDLRFYDIQIIEL